MAGPVETCNLALNWLSARTINLLTENTEEARQCSANYEIALLATLEDREWTFAIKRVKLDTALAEAPAFKWLYQFLVPSDFLQSIEVFDNPEGRGPEIQHAIEDNRIMANVPTIYMKYKFKQTDPNRMSSTFIQAHAALMASFMAMPLTSNTDLQATMMNLYSDRIIRATSNDALQGSREMLDRSTQEQSRRHFTPID